ncbi:MAG: DUF3800 domain-containing protein [Planctomycetota bacterium]|nr:DUF3800 domain-containing protein [Planctomycetota bacterium]
MYICYLDESGTDIIGSGTSHFVYLGLAIPAETWKAKDEEISAVLKKYGLENREVHTGWIARRYLEQERIAGFDAMNWDARRAAVEAERREWLVKTAALKTTKNLDELKKNLRKTAAYVHLTRGERATLLRELASMIGGWKDARLFAEAIDKTTFRTQPPPMPLYEQAFTQMVQRFQAFLTHKGEFDKCDIYGLLVHDTNETVSKKLTELMRSFHAKGTFFWKITRIVETPLFVDSRLTAMVQMADVCAYATRRFFENAEEDLFNRVHDRFDRSGGRVVGIRHYRHRGRCTCRVCAEHS